MTKQNVKPIPERHQQTYERLKGSSFLTQYIKDLALQLMEELGAAEAENKRLEDVLQRTMGDVTRITGFLETRVAEVEQMTRDREQLREQLHRMIKAIERQP